MPFAAVWPRHFHRRLKGTPACRRLLLLSQGSRRPGRRAKGCLGRITRSLWDARRSPSGRPGLGSQSARTDCPGRIWQAGRPQAQPADPEDRPAAVAGAFYPGKPAEVDQMLEEFLVGQPAEPPQAWAAALVPHAGWIYSGRLAAAVLSRVKIPERVVILAPRHHADGPGWAVAPYRHWLIPGGQVAGDIELAWQLAGAVSGLELDARPHRREHAIEVQLPILHRLAPESRMVGITIGPGDLPELAPLRRATCGLLAGLPERPLLLISSDMNHFADESRTRSLDRLALDAMASLDPARLYETVQEHQISMCGMRPAVIVMETLAAAGPAPLLPRSGLHDQCRAERRHQPRGRLCRRAAGIGGSKTGFFAASGRYRLVDTPNRP